MKKLKQSLSIIILALLMLPNTILAYSDYLIPGGENVAIDIKSKGIIIVGIYDIDGVKPAMDAGLKVGDIILKVNNTEVNSIDELLDIIDKSKEKINIEYERDSIKHKTTLKLIKKDNIYKTGIYVKDGITGIGTLTYIDPGTNIYGALGHEIIESNTGTLIEVSDGAIYSSDVINIERSTNGVPGSKIANLNLNNPKGNILENTNKGIFGQYLKEIPNKKKYKVAKLEDIKLGKAKILTVISGDEIKEYNINIIDIMNDETKNILFEITDNELINNTGGIIQGMSGSPIIQDNYIIGAVTHVVIDDPKKGYGIWITSMLEEGEN